MVFLQSCPTSFPLIKPYVQFSPIPDFRKTLSELVVENHYAQLTSLLKERGMKRYSESHESGRTLIADGTEVKRSAAVPMSAMWRQGLLVRMVRATKLISVNGHIPLKVLQKITRTGIVLGKQQKRQE